MLVSAPVHAFEQPQDGVYRDRIDWGLSMDLSGPVANAQGQFAKGFRARMNALNEKGGVNGRTVNVLSEDSRYDVAVERAIIEKLATQTPALGLSGMGNSSAQVALLPLIKSSKLPVVGAYTSTKAATIPANPYFYGAFCGYRQMAQVGVGYFSDKTNPKAPKVATVHLDSASGKEFFDYVDEAVKSRGGSNIALPIKVTAADATAQLLEIVRFKPDYIAIHGTPTTALLVMRGLQHYAVNVPVFAITYLGTPAVYESLGPQAGKSYYFVSCFSPSSADTKVAADLIAAADKYGYSALKDDVNFVSGWVVGEMVTQALAKVGAEPTRAKLTAMMDAGFEFDAKGLSPKLVYTPTDHEGLKSLKPFGFDYTSNRFTSFGEYSDYDKYVK